mmetsp:Transcript_3734/g.9412  ORF Transcript_3734/g.9412 Transcript_3734/m.9412 type:complete len:139 (+) Transcript_3734:376-792(+)
MAARAAQGIVGAVLLAGGTFAGASYYTIWNSEQQVHQIEGDLKGLEKALQTADKDIDEHMTVLQAAEKQKEEFQKKVFEVKQNIAKAEDRVSALKSDLSHFDKELAKQKQKLAAEKEKKEILNKVRKQRVESMTVRVS